MDWTVITAIIIIPSDIIIVMTRFDTAFITIVAIATAIHVRILVVVTVIQLFFLFSFFLLPFMFNVVINIGLVIIPVPVKGIAGFRVSETFGFGSFRMPSIQRFQDLYGRFCGIWEFWLVKASGA